MSTSNRLLNLSILLLCLAMFFVAFMYIDYKFLHSGSGAPLPYEPLYLILLGIIVALLIIINRKLKEDRKLYHKLYRETRYQAELISNISDAIVSTDIHMTIETWNNSCEKLYGWKPEEAIGKDIWTVLPQLRHSTLYTACMEAMVQQQEQVAELYDEMVNKWASYKIYPSASGLILHLKDVTAEKDSQQTILEQKAFSESIINSLPGMFYLFDTHGKFLLWNKNLETVTGYTHAEVSGMKPDEFFETGADQDYIRERIEKVFVEGSAEAETYVLTKDSHKIPYHFTGLRLELNGATCLMGMGLDRTAFKKAQDEVRLSEERFQLIANATSELIWDWNMETDEGWWNENFYTHYGYDKNTLPQGSASWLSAIHPEDKDKVLDEMQHAIQQKETFWLGEYRFLKANGEVRYVKDRGYIFYSDEGVPVRMLGSFLDITEQKESEKELNDLNNQLRTLSVYLQQMREKERQFFAHEIHEDLGQQLAQIKVAISSLTASSKKLEEAMVEETLDDMQHSLDRSINTVRKISAELYPSILNDIGLVEALQWHAESFTKQTGLSVNFFSEVDNVALSQEQVMTLYRTFEESLLNTLQHSATEIIAILKEEGGQVILSIADNGTCTCEVDHNDIELVALKERILSAKGHLEIERDLTEGTSIIICIPIAE